GHVLALQRAGIGRLDLVDDLRDAVGPEKGRAVAALQFTDLLGDVRAIVEQLEQLAVERVDLLAQRQQFRGRYRFGGWGVGGLRHGASQRPAGSSRALARPPEASRCRSMPACRPRTCGL